MKWRFADLPLAAQVAVEWLGNGERTRERLDSLLDHFSEGMAYPLNEVEKDAATYICKMRYPDFK